MVRAELLLLALYASTALPQTRTKETFEPMLGDFAGTLSVYMNLVVLKERVLLVAVAIRLELDLESMRRFDRLLCPRMNGSFQRSKFYFVDSRVEIEVVLSPLLLPR